MNFGIVGAGFSGAVMARALAEQGHDVVVVDERAHVAGNCHTARDAETGVMTHWYGPHIFHTSSERVWEYVQRFATMMPFQHRVRAHVKGAVYSLPINLMTINQFFRTCLGPGEAAAFLRGKADPNIEHPRSLEEQALAFLGAELYEAFFKGYTKKQWGIDPSCLPASLLKRLPVRFDYNDSYFAHPHQAIPFEGYTAMVARILDTPRVRLHLGCRFEDLNQSFDHVFYTGAIDRFFRYELGSLPYRTLDFHIIRAKGDYQGTAVMNYCDEEVPHTRVTEHKHFAPWEAATLSHTICFKETSRLANPEDIPFYPIRLVSEERLLAAYVARARTTSQVSFLGRLGTYRYLDMDMAILEALEASDRVIAALSSNAAIPTFFQSPIAAH